MQKLYFCGCGKAFFALRRKSRKTGLGLRGPECKNYIFAAAEKHFSHSGENPGKPA
ncbi:Uncharacterized protein dnm_043830 [Desulfonema magnum]|uniref:Uncharacterized protein n=2 Tax=Desulfonema magnum TaxID=45655 RepID=A0A975BMU4_9BACT|nr:Uncharacterized protein dnm_043830 [Desulfonema magnum]